jgi:hypothetical protein
VCNVFTSLQNPHPALPLFPTVLQILKSPCYRITFQQFVTRDRGVPELPHFSHIAGFRFRSNRPQSADDSSVPQGEYKRIPIRATESSSSTLKECGAVLFRVGGWLLSSPTSCGGTRCAVGWGTALQTGRLRVRFPMVSLEFSIDYGPGVDSVSYRNEYQEHFLRGKGGRCVGLTTLPPSCADCLEIWNPQTPATLRAYPSL